VRLFVASWLGAENQAFYGALASRLAARGHGLRGVPTGSVHLTYAFVPVADEADAATIAGVVSTVAASHEAFPILLGPPRFLWHRRTPRLIELPVVKGAGAFNRLVEALAAGVRRTIPDLRFSPSKSPHATIARFRRQATRADALSLEQLIDVGERSDGVDDVAIVGSRLTPAGPVYDVRSSVRLG
jgi:2'-5' RNA ligase